MGGEPGGTLWDKTNYAAGVEYGYSLPVANRLNIDFTLGVGYWGGKYYEYIPLTATMYGRPLKNAIGSVPRRRKSLWYGFSEKATATTRKEA